jgi:hypothetical protein
MPLYMDLVLDPFSDSFFRDFILFKIFLKASKLDSIENIFASLLFGFSFSSGSIVWFPIRSFDFGANCLNRLAFRISLTGPELFSGVVSLLGGALYHVR